jgi:glycosyltransferase involved in cell wall biosynthesis
MQATANTPNLSHENTILTSRIKVLHIISGDLWAGAEVQAFTLITTLGNQCDIVVALMNHGELEKRLQQAGVNTIVINEQLLSSLDIIRHLTKLIRRFQPDIIHTHRQKENILGSVANLVANKSLFRRARSVRTTHGAQEHKVSGLKKIIIWLDNACGKYLQDAVISVSHDLHRQLKKIFSENKIHIVQNGIDVDALRQITPAADIRLHLEDHFHIGIIGRLEPVKRVDLFIRAAQQLILRQPALKVRFHIIGDGKLKEDHIALAQQLNIADHITFHGHRSDSVHAIAAMDLVVMCSDHEGTPMTALETLALGKPLVAHNVGGLREILSDSPELLVHQHTACGYSSTILDTLLHPVRPVLKGSYTSDQNAASTFALYQNLLNVG